MKNRFHLSAKAGARLVAFLALLVSQPLGAQDAVEVAEVDGAARDEAEETRLSSRVEGFVLSVAVRKGDKVEKGQVLLDVDPSEHQLLTVMAEAKIRVAKSGIEISEATCDLAKGALERLERLEEEGAVASGEKQRAAFNVKTAEAELRGKLAMLEIAEAEAQLMKLYLERCQVRSPVAGTVAEVGAHVGEAVGKGQILLRLVPAE